jgi:hypothetical protein
MVRGDAARRLVAVYKLGRSVKDEINARDALEPPDTVASLLEVLSGPG